MRACSRMQILLGNVRFSGNAVEEIEHLRPKVLEELMYPSPLRFEVTLKVVRLYTEK